MILCLVTDRTRTNLVEQARRAIDAGIDFIQVRERDLDAAELAAIVTVVVRTARASSTRVLVNDRLDVALACGAGGVHLRADSMSASRVRAIAPAGFVIGRSVHSVEEAVQSAADVDYLIAGTVFRTLSKPDRHSVIGLDGLAAIAGHVSVPVLAIGGVTLDSVGSIARAGASGVAAIGLFAGPRSLVEVAAEARRRFDSEKAAS